MNLFKHSYITKLNLLLHAFNSNQYKLLIRDEVIADLNKERKARQKARQNLDLCPCGNRIDKTFKHLGL